MAVGADVALVSPVMHFLRLRDIICDDKLLVGGAVPLVIWLGCFHWLVGNAVPVG